MIQNPYTKPSYKNEPNEDTLIQSPNYETSHISVATYHNDPDDNTVILSASENLTNGWQTQQDSAVGAKSKSLSCDDLLSERQEKDGKHERPQNVSQASEERRRHRSAHDAPGFLKLYKTMHHINRQELTNAVVCSVKSRIRNYENEQLNNHGSDDDSYNNVIPLDMVHNRISQFESLIQKSKSMPNLGSGYLSMGPGTRINSPNHSYDTRESVLDEEPVLRNPQEGQPQYPKLYANVAMHIETTDHMECSSNGQQDFSDSEGLVSDLSDFIQIEDSSLCSESDLDHCSLNSLDNCSSDHHNYHRQLVSSCKGRCPASYTRFTTMIKHERAKKKQKQMFQMADNGLNKLAFLVSPVPFQRSSLRDGRASNSKCCMYRALDSALKDIYEHICAEKCRANLPENSILHRLLTELLPEVPARNSSLQALNQSRSARNLSSYHPQHDGIRNQDWYPPEHSSLGCNESVNNLKNYDAHQYFEGGFNSSVSNLPTSSFIPF